MKERRSGQFAETPPETRTPVQANQKARVDAGSHFILPPPDAVQEQARRDVYASVWKGFSNGNLALVITPELRADDTDPDAVALMAKGWAERAIAALDTAGFKFGSTAHVQPLGRLTVQRLLPGTPLFESGPDALAIKIRQSLEAQERRGLSAKSWYYKEQKTDDPLEVYGSAYRLPGVGRRSIIAVAGYGDMRLDAVRGLETVDARNGLILTAPKDSNNIPAEPWQLITP